MKTSFKSFILFGLIICSTISCSEDDNGSGIFAPEVAQGIIGEWESSVRSVLFYFGNVDRYEYGENPFGTVGRTASGKWELKDDTLYIKYDSTQLFASVKYAVRKLDEDSLILDSRLSSNGAYDYRFPFRRREKSEESCCPFK